MTTTINGFNVGTDVRFAISDQFGQVFSDQMLGHMMEFESESDDTELKVVPITTGGVPIYTTLWSGIRGTMMFTRVNGTFQKMFMELMDAYYAAGIISQMSITATVRNRDGSVDEYLYTGVQLSRPRFGNYRSTKEVDLRVEFRASKMTSTGTQTTFLNAMAAI